MKQRKPPAFARWMLHQLMPGEADEALTGDLLEDFHSGRSVAWYWRQAVSAIFIRWAVELRVRRTMLLFAALWAMLAPAWLLTVTHIEQFAHLGPRFAQLNWPWNSLGNFASMLAANLFFLWTGIALYLLPKAWRNGKLRVRPLAHGIAASLPVILVLWLALIVLPLHFVAANTTQQNVSLSRSPTPLEATILHNRSVWARYDRQLIRRQSEARDRLRTAATEIAPPGDGSIDLRPSTMLVRVPFFLVVFCALWPSKFRRERVTV